MDAMPSRDWFMAAFAFECTTRIDQIHNALGSLNEGPYIWEPWDGWKGFVSMMSEKGSAAFKDLLEMDVRDREELDLVVYIEMCAKTALSNPNYRK